MTARIQAGVINVDKPAGATSFQVVKRLRDLSGARRVGHAGTLDPLATGVLPILFESATRLSDLAHTLPKTYEAEIRLGSTTATDDAEGTPENVADASGVTGDDLGAVLPRFVGRVLQEPPAFSAVKINGQRSYARARAGDLERPPAREVEIFSIDVLAFEGGPEAIARVRVVCGSGTYLRSLARDLGSALRVGGHLGRLVRTAYGPLRIEDAVVLDALHSRDAVLAAMRPAEDILPPMEAVRLGLEQEAMVRQGRSVRVLPEPGHGHLRAHGADGQLVAIGHADPLKRLFVPDKVLS